MRSADGNWQIVQPGVFSLASNGVSDLLDELVRQWLDACIAFEERRKAQARFHAARLAASRSMAPGKPIMRPSLAVRRLPYLHANTFVFALDYIARAASRLAAIPDAPAGVRAALDDFREAFPGLKGGRDSAHHRDERLVGIANRHRIEPKPVHTAQVNASIGITVLECFEGSLVGSTAENGEVAQVDVSETSLEAAHDCIVKILALYPWHGPPQVHRL